MKSVIVVRPGGALERPKGPLAMEHIANRPIVCHVIEALVRCGGGQPAVVSPAAEIAELRRCLEPGLPRGVDVTYLPCPDRADVLEALRAAAPFVGEDAAIVHFGDGLLDQPLDEFTELLATAGAPDLLLLLHRSAAPDDRLPSRTQKLLGVLELADSRTHLALADVCLFRAGALADAVDAIAADGPETDMIAVADKLVALGRSVDATVARTWRRYHGDPLELLELNRLVLDRQSVNGEGPELADNRIEGRVIIDPSADVRSSTILGPCIIGRDARITSSYIGPYTSVGAGAEIEGAEVVGSIVSEGVRIMHIQGRIEGSTIGRSARIFRDFRLPRAMRLHVGDGVQLALD